MNLLTDLFAAFAVDADPPTPEQLMQNCLLGKVACEVGVCIARGDAESMNHVDELIEGYVNSLEVGWFEKRVRKSKMKETAHKFRGRVHGNR